MTESSITKELWDDYRDVQRRITPCLDAMRSWLRGDPVWKYQTFLDTWGADFQTHQYLVDDFRGDPGHRLKRSVFHHELRDEWIRRFGFAIPCAELLDALACFKSGVIEIGAGTGYMTRLMRNRGINVIGSDPGIGHRYGFTIGKYDPHQSKSQAKTFIRAHPKAAVFCSWPSLNETWFRQALKAMRIGQWIMVVREDACAENSAWEYMDDCFVDLEAIRIPTFFGMHDHAIIAVKKRQRVRHRLAKDHLIGEIEDE